MRSWCVTVWLSTAAVACSAGTAPLSARDADAATGTDAGPIDVRSAAAAYCDAFVDISRVKRAECYGGSVEDYRVVDAEYLSTVGCDDLLAELDAGMWHFDPARAAISLATLPSMPCAEIYRLGFQHGLDSRADDVPPVTSWVSQALVSRISGGAFSGAQQDGALGCSERSCAPGLSCVPSWRANTTRCLRVDTVAVGESCDSQRTCPTGSLCEQTDEMLWCDHPGVCGTPPPVPPGAGDSCADRPCTPRSYCALASNTCLPIEGEGSRCYEEGGRPVLGANCGAPELECVAIDFAGSAAVCKHKRRIGESCGALIGFCLGGGLVNCVSFDGTTQTGVCHLAVPDGEPCEQSNACLRSSCVMGICRPPLALGMACRDDHDCASRRCADAICVEGDPVPEWPMPICD